MAAAPQAAPLKVLEVIEKTGVALVEAPPDATKAPIERGSLYPVVHYRVAITQIRAGRTRLSADNGPPGIECFRIRLNRSDDRSPVQGAIVALRLQGKKYELTAVSNASGVATFGVRASAVRGATLAVYPEFGGHWGHFEPRVDLDSGAEILIDPIDLASAPDSLRGLLDPGSAEDGAGVTVAVIDTGVGPHVDLPYVDGDHDTSSGHGTHVAGIISGRGREGWRGMAPGARIRSYRVFNDPATGLARNFEVHRAITQAVDDGCHLINLSLKKEFEKDPTYDDPVLSVAIEEATDRGVLVLAAAGNDFRRFIAFPARHPDVIAVSALGWEPGMPARAYDRWTISRDRGNPRAEIFFASFSNEGVDGTSVDIIGPGAGVVSTVPGDRYAPMSGTSMACPAMTGVVARLLSRRPDILSMPPDRNRTVAMRDHALQSIVSLGLGPSREGRGMIS